MLGFVRMTNAPNSPSFNVNLNIIGACVCVYVYLNQLNNLIKFHLEYCSLLQNVDVFVALSHFPFHSFTQSFNSQCILCTAPNCSYTYS